ncbi:hypothetical protein BAUCODRAFT_34912 [Baudoinia panamericana UAMH 10762]|uniref:Uncharacterized protein n=1 Tax=Baudoinia panamericana (strain UAMH 10762) TaxID=717646 RepID=M2N759_BAUPA|nr:uncharacterized protein BAUCODRAFT_34912 [Baudoinia panamericana UAMH 10762]EMC94909.1 hypothetical protein BAUCODRAFT_34912 [Baudoinia panamericana UAMH 10762]
MQRTTASSSRTSTGTLSRLSPESFDSLYRRNQAAEILQSYEKLSWFSFHRCESLVQTRLHFQNLAAGFTPEDEATRVRWKEDFTPHPPKPGEDGRKGKSRVSSTSNAAGPSTAIADASGSRGDSKGKGYERSHSGAYGGASAASSHSSKKRKSGGGGSG